MIKTDNIYFYLIVLTMIATIVSPVIVGFLDEFIALLFCAIVTLDIVVNRKWKDYCILYVMVGIMAFYAILSVTSHHFNTTKAILYDFVLQLKPLVPFAISYVAYPLMTKAQKKIIRVLCVALTVIAALIFFSGATDAILEHVSVMGNAIFTLFVFYLYCAIDENGQLSKERLIIALVIVSVGLLSTRSKYYGEFGFAVFMMFFYKPGMFKSLKPSYIFAFCVMVVAVFMAIYPKLEYYFFQDIVNNVTEDEDMSFARPALYYGMSQIITDYPILGTGLASYAVYASTPSVGYSALYADYHLDKVWGLSEDYPSFICDTFYPELAQFGIVGIMLFIVMWCWIYRRLRIILRQGDKYRFMIGVLCIAFILIESTTNSTFTKVYGEAIMMLLGMIIAPTRLMSRGEKISVMNNKPYTYTMNIQQ